MRILHTADWHLGDRLGRIDRTEDLRRAVERVGTWCKSEKIDVLLVAGDLFSELARPDGLREAIHHWQGVFREFLHEGGTIITITGNHDNENFCQTLIHAMNLAAPGITTLGEEVSIGRMYLAAEPTMLRLPDRFAPFKAQFLLMPYPTPSRYLKDQPTIRYSSPEEKNQQLTMAFRETLHRMQKHDRFDKSLPTVLSAHIHVFGATMGASLFRLTEQEDVIFNEADIAEDFAYVALGHIHKPQFLGGKKHIRYSGSIERMDLGEKNDAKSVVVFEIGPEGLRGDPTLLPLTSTPIYEIEIRNPSQDIPRLREEYASQDAENHLVNLHISYTAGVDNLDEILQELEQLFPRWYSRDWKESSVLGPSLSGEADQRTRSFSETVREFVSQELTNHTTEEQQALLSRLEALLQEMEEK